ncbi:unnamed protein product [Rotaria sordida]|uniref:Uncharacterized protein n=1 Tax=Rotaria sordida TaxID=392033 RepID=A0A813UXD6_9BILA|nr:unnamed protein product [Rotaria sordida]CAF3845926.1 unnamed protein product [Rotaria sordida]
MTCYDIFVIKNKFSSFSSSSSDDRIRNGAKKLAKARTITQQGRLDSFFTVSRTVTTTTPTMKKAEANIATNKGLKRKNGFTNNTTPKEIKSLILTMSSSTSKVQTKTQAANTQRNESKTLTSGSTVSVKQPGKQVSVKINKNGTIQNCHEILKSIQREYEQFEVDMRQSD